MCEKKTTHAKHGGIIESNIRRTIQERLRSNLDFRNRPRLCIRANETGTRNKQTLQICDNRRKTKRILPIFERIPRFADKPTIFQEKIDRTLGHQTPVWLDDIIFVTRGTKGEHTRKLHSVLTKLENEGYRASKKSKFYQKETLWLGHTISQDGIRPNKEKTDAISKLEPPTSTKTLKSFLGAIQYFAKFIPNLSEKTDNMRQLLKKETKWEWTTDRNSDYNKIKMDLTTLPCLAHYNGSKYNIVTTDACKTGLGVALWQKQGDGELKPIAFASRYLNDAEKNIPSEN